MYGNNSIQDPYFMLLYGLTMMLAATKQSLP